jgi:hypothetical protein
MSPEVKAEALYCAYTIEQDDKWLPELRRLIESGVRATDWELAPVARRAIERGHPRPELLQQLAEVLNGRTSPETLRFFPEWARA